MYPLVDEKGHDIELRFLHKESGAELQDYLVTGEEFALHTLFKNLIVNAIKYTPSHGKILVSLKQSESSIRVAVMDSGSGIKPVDRERIFERFYRADGDRNNSKVIGCGLGLAIVKQMADLHHAKINTGQSEFIFDDKVITAGLRIEIVFNKDAVEHDA